MQQHHIKGQSTMNNGNHVHFDDELAKAKIYAEIMQMLADMRKKDAETAKINKETVWYPLLIATGLIGAIAALVKLFF